MNFNLIKGKAKDYYPYITTSPVFPFILETALVSVGLCSLKMCGQNLASFFPQINFINPFRFSAILRNFWFDNILHFCQPSQCSKVLTFEYNQYLFCRNQDKFVLTNWKFYNPTDSNSKWRQPHYAQWSSGL